MLPDMTTRLTDLGRLLDEHTRKLRGRFLATSYRWGDRVRRYRHERGEIRTLIHLVRALRLAVGVRPHLTLTHAEGDRWTCTDRVYGRTFSATTDEVGRSWVSIRMDHGPVLTSSPRGLSVVGWRRVDPRGTVIVPE